MALRATLSFFATLMREIKEIHASEGDKSLSADEALSIDARITLGSEMIFVLATTQENDKPILATSISLTSSEEGGMQKLFWDHPLLSLPFRSSTILVEDGSPFAIVPEDLMDSASPENWLSLTTELEGRKVLTKAIEEEHLYIIYSVNRELFDFCQRSFSLPTFEHHISTQITYTLRKSRREHPQVVTAYISKGFIQVAVAKSGELLLANLYKMVSDADCLYYITALYRQFKLDPHAVPLYLFTYNPEPSIKQLLEESLGNIVLNDYSTDGSKEVNKSVTVHPLERLHILCGL